LNEIYFGSGAYGVNAAAKIFFGKSIEDLTLSEAALLAGFPRAPNRYSPFKNIVRAYRRRSFVLRRMNNRGMINKIEERKANCQPIKCARPEKIEKQASYFTEYLRLILEPRYGTHALFKGGLKIYTTLNLKMQKIARELLIEHLEKFDKQRVDEIHKLEKEGEELPMALITDEDGNEIPEKKVQGAIIALDTKSGGIRVMVGGRDFKQTQFNRAIQMKRQPGSGFKPFIYLAALDTGYTQATILEDSPVAFYNDGVNWKLLSKTT
ncbi:unnamed protein product, partial [marine sediment metagenome]